MNVEFMRRLADVIERENRFDMSWWSKTVDLDGETHPENLRPADLISGRVRACKTVGCVAGWANAIDGYRDLGDSEHAAEVLGLADREASRLFHTDRGSVWAGLTAEYGWMTSPDGWVDTEGVSASQAAQVLRRIADGTIQL